MGKIPGGFCISCYNKSGIVTARPGDGGMLCFKMSAGSRKWNEYK